MPILNDPQQERYCQLRCEGMTKTAAFEKAGYKRNGQEAWRLGTKPLVSTCVDEQKRAGAKLAQVSADRSRRRGLGRQSSALLPSSNPGLRP